MYVGAAVCGCVGVFFVLFFAAGTKTIAKLRCFGLQDKKRCLTVRSRWAKYKIIQSAASLKSDSVILVTNVTAVIVLQAG